MHFVRGDVGEMDHAVRSGDGDQVDVGAVTRRAGDRDGCAVLLRDGQVPAPGDLHVNRFTFGMSRI